MRPQAGIVALLNDVLTNELTSVNQYFLHARMLRNWGVTKLGDYEYHQSIDEMKDADHLIDRLLYFDGHPNLQRLDTIRTGEDPAEKLALALTLEQEAIARLNDGIALCVDRGDNGTRDLLAEILEGEEEHADWLESQLSLIEQLGQAHYLAQQIRD